MRFSSLCLLLLFTITLVSCKTRGLLSISTSKPHVYSSDQTTMTLNAIDSSIDDSSVTGGKYQEAFAVIDSVRRSLNLSISPTALALVDSAGNFVRNANNSIITIPEGENPPANHTTLPIRITAPDAPNDAGSRFGTTNFAPISSDGDKSYIPDDSNLGIRYEDKLRALHNNKQLSAQRRLLYIGDLSYQNPDKRAYLVKFNVSINQYLATTSYKQFAHVKFMVRGYDQNKQETNVEIYGLLPEYSSIVAKESLVNSVLNDYSGQLGGSYSGIDAKATGSLQKYVQETLVTAIERPLEFAIYQNKRRSSGVEDKHSSFVFAFGPRRTLEKRSWINPARWFGNTYRIDYEIHPGLRTCYAIVVTDKKTSSFSFDIQHKKRAILANSAVSIDNFSSEDITDKYRGLTCQNSSLNPTKSVYPTELYKGKDNTFYITSDVPVSNAVKVLVGNLEVKNNIEILGRFSLKIELSEDDIEKIGDGDTKKIVIISSHYGLIEAGKVVIK